MENEQQKLTSKKVNKPWYEVWWRAILAVLFFPFVGVYLTWTKTDWNKFVKIGITIVCAIILMTGGWAMFLIFPLIPFLIIYLIKIKLKATWIKSGLIFLAVSFGSFTILWIIAYAITKDTPSIIIPEESKHDILDVNGSGVRSNSKVRIYLNDREVSEVSANEDGKFSTDIELKEGDNEIYAAVRYDKKTKESSKKIVKYISPAMIKKAEEEKQKAEKEKRQAEEKKQNEEKQRAEEEKKKLEETKKAEEVKKAEEQRKAEEAKKAQEEKQKKEEAKKAKKEKFLLNVSYIEAMNYLTSFFDMQQSNSDGKKTYTGMSTNLSSTLSIYGEKENITKAKLMVSFPADTQSQIFIENSAITLRFLKNLLDEPHFNDASKWVPAAAVELKSSNDSKKEKIYGNRKVIVSISAQMGMVFVTIIHKDAPN